MADDLKDEFYVGYLPQAPGGIAARVRLVVFLIFAVTLGVGLLLVNAQSRFPGSVFEFGVETEFTGVVYEKPYPVLRVLRPGQVGGMDPYSSYYLTVFGKRGASAAISGMDGQAIHMRGSLIYRDHRTMIQIAPGSVEPLQGPAAAALLATPRPGNEDLGVHTLAGEIVDSKCFLGVMKPGNLKAHRSCAARCISGGVPPILLVRDGAGGVTYFMLVSEDGDAVNKQVLPYLAEPVEITGRVVRQGDLLLLQAAPASIRRLPE